MRTSIAFVLAAAFNLGWVTAAVSAAPLEPLGISLEGYAYPFEVKFLPLKVGGHAVRMAYMDVAPANANGRAVVLLHGRNFPASYWEPTIRSLTAEGYRVVAPDMINFGKSSKLDDVPVNWDASSTHLVNLLDHLGLARVEVVAHSMGNMLGARFVRTFPDRVNKLVMYGPVGLEDYRLYVPPVPVERLIEQESKQTAEQYYNYMDRTYGLTIPKEKVWPFVEIRERMKLSADWPRWVAAFVSSYYAMWGQPYVHELPFVKTPTLMMVGTGERQATGQAFAPPELQPKMGHIVDLARAAVKQMSNARIEVFEGSGHLIHLEMPEKFHQTLLAFLRT